MVCRCEFHVIQKFLRAHTVLVLAFSTTNYTRSRQAFGGLIPQLQSMLAPPVTHHRHYRHRHRHRHCGCHCHFQGTLIEVSVELLHNASSQLVIGARATDCDVTAALNVSFGPGEGAIEKDVIDLFLKLAKKEINSTLCDGIVKLVSL